MTQALSLDAATSGQAYFLVLNDKIAYFSLRLAKGHTRREHARHRRHSEGGRRALFVTQQEREQR